MLLKLIRAYLECILSGHKWYRRKKGGKWYQIRDQSFAGGFEGPLVCWVRQLEDWPGCEILKEEDWSIPVASK